MVFPSLLLLRDKETCNWIFPLAEGFKHLMISFTFSSDLQKQLWRRLPHHLHHSLESEKKTQVRLHIFINPPQLLPQPLSPPCLRRNGGINPEHQASTLRWISLLKTHTHTHTNTNTLFHYLLVYLLISQVQNTRKP